MSNSENKSKWELLSEEMKDTSIITELGLDKDVEPKKNEIDLYSDTIDDPNQKAYIDQMNIDDFKLHRQQEDNFQYNYELIKDKEPVETITYFNNNEKVRCSLYEKDGIIIVAEGGMRIRRYKLIGQRKRKFKPKNIVTIKNLEKIFKPKIERGQKNNEVITFNIEKIGRKLNNHCYSFDGDIIDIQAVVFKNHQTKQKQKELSHFENKQKIEELNRQVERLQNELQEERANYSKSDLYNDEVEKKIEDSNQNCNVLKEENKKLVIKCKQLESQLSNMKRAHSILVKKYHTLNQKYKSLTGKDFN
jgi:hypothetical protein